MVKGDFETACINTIRLLSVDAVERAKSGHPGMPMGAAAMAYTLFTKFLKFNPKDPGWPGRDRFILSAGHGSMLLYSLLYLLGYDISLDDIKDFRQYGSKTPGHPEHGHTPGVEMTTGPLGQGFASGVGMAIALRHLAARYNKKDFKPVNDSVFAIVGDGDLMEGISSEAASLAGHLGLSNIVYLYDDNKISIEGSTKITFTEDVTERFNAYGWRVFTVQDGNNVKNIATAIKKAIKEGEKPSLIRIRTHIGFGSPNKVDSESAHGSPLGEEEAVKTKENLGWPTEPQFYVPDGVKEFFEGVGKRGELLNDKWSALMNEYSRRYPDEGRELSDIFDGKLPKGWEKALEIEFEADKKIATRAASGRAINALSGVLPNMMGGSADLAPSNNTYMKEFPEFQKGSYGGRNIRFGVREHAMASALNGMALCGMVPYGGTFLIFADYMRPAIRLASLMGLGVIYVFTHDSIGVGEDGPTHQPIEHLASLRIIPNLTVIRPADAVETAEAWRLAIENRGGPTALILTRQGLPILDRKRFPKAAEIRKGAYVLTDDGGTPDVVLIGSGSEVSLVLDAAEMLKKEKVKIRVVNMASFDLFDAQGRAYREKVLPPGVLKIAVEAASPIGWDRYVGDDGKIMAINRFGASAPGNILFEKFGFTPGAVLKTVKKLLEK
ncbi:MAG: transketolase [Deltaproteobacteria bacterium]|uniref:Transketolase n=1 Tax=Candidatus Zymogenus saltonus TaxID=2844893 RepID=A0A9D8KGL5_9DELT|nr:transketolase [Candidatus Zymogenus saltonus]